MKILLSWIKKFIKYKFNYNNLYKIFNNLGIEIKYIKKIYPIKYINSYDNIIKCKILHIYKNYNKYIYKINLNYIVYSKFFFKKNTEILIIKNKSNYNIISSSYDIDYIIYLQFTPNINFLSYYINLSNYIYYYLKYNNKNVSLLKFTNFKNKKYIKYSNKINILCKNKNLVFLKAFYINIKNYKYIYNKTVLKRIILTNNINLNYNINDNINLLIKETGIPIEILDIDKINNKKIVIKNNNKNINFYIKKKKFIKFKKKNKDIFLYNNNIPISIAGIINNYNYNISEKTKKILLLISIYKYKKILKTSKLYNINTFISNIYKNKINIYNINYLINEIKLLFNNNIEEVYNYNKIFIKYKLIKIKFKYIYQFIGINIKKNIILKIIKSFYYKIIYYNNHYIVIKINNLFFINDKIDIINDIIKYLDINYINDNKRHINIPIKRLNNLNYNVESTIYNILINYGMYEVINTPFLNNIILKNNILLREKLFYNIINNISYNINRKNYNLKLFEISNCYYKKKNKKYKEERRIEILITKKKIKNNINYLYKIYNILYIILERIGIKDYKKKILFNKKNIIKIIFIYKKKKIITLSLINNEFYNINQFVYYSVIYIKEIIKFLIIKKNIKYKKYSKYQYIKKDLTFIINKNIYYEDFYKLAKKKLKKRLIKLNLFDIYTKNLPKNKKSYTLRFIIRNEFGINKKYINNLLNNIIKIFFIKLGAKLKKLL
ncbi:MAG: phenylalanine--tRNA ligase beta subunit-related protein [Candidatus Shikimatogenerans sp. JK-2022]|nr:phenylalanine--tRNA ligase beta subunit-related protein [Candidatus Shikimatogenerans bostrichidophilus]